MTAGSGLDGRALFLAFMGAVILVAVVLAVVGGRPTLALAGEDGPPAMLRGIAVGAAGSLAGGVFLFVAGPRLAPPAAALGSMAFRLAALLAVGVAVFVMERPDVPAFLIWIGISHLAILPVDAAYAVRAKKSL